MTRGGRQRWIDLLSLATFVALGLPDGILGTAWPSLRQSFGAPVADLGLVLLVSTTGSVLVAVFVGSLIRRLGVPVVVAAGLACAGAAGAGYAVAPVFGVILGAALLFGLAAGLMDGGLNTAVGLSGRARLLNLLHGAYGVGTAIGPLVVTVALLGGSWRPAYVVLLGLDLALGGLWVLHRRSRSGIMVDRRAMRQASEASVADDDADPPAVVTKRPQTDVPARTAPEAPPPAGIIVAGIVVFFVYTGLEVSAGQWETTFARLGLRVSASTAGVATFGYWASLTAARIGLALLPRPPAPQTVVGWGCRLAVVATGLIWWDPATPVTIAGFVMLGACLAGVFPALIALTPGRLGERRAANAIAWQVGAAAAGGAGISALVGLLIGLTNVAALGPSLLSLAILLVTAELILTRLARA